MEVKGRVLDSLRGVNPYPLPLRTIERIAVSRGIDLMAELTEGVIASNNYQLALSDLYLELSCAPDISQGGQSYSFTDEQRRAFRSRSNAILNALGIEPVEDVTKPVYGYKGSKL